ncbi:MAG TPA: response regulator, partial [Myxococcota bacterium]|nr:response regulator [Myxococcota bacterium]
MSKRILVIDDDADLVTSTSALLAAHGYTVSGAMGAAEGRKAIRDLRPDLVVLDIMMETDAAGFDLAYALKADPATRNLPIVILSSFQDHLADKGPAFEHVMGRDWPAAELLEKPADPAKLTAVVSRL